MLKHLKSTAAGGLVAGLVIGGGVALAIACPLAGLVAGAYFLYTAAQTAAMGTIAAVLLGVVGASVGAGIGAFAGKLTLLASIPAAIVAGVITKGVTSLAGRGLRAITGTAKSVHPVVSTKHAVTTASSFVSRSISSVFSGVSSRLHKKPVAVQATVEAIEAPKAAA